MPNLYLISGCNGAGKTTASLTVLPELLNCKEFVNADSIASGLSPLNPDSVSFQAGKLMLERINELKNLNVDFAIETTLTTLSYKNLILDCKKTGYEITIVFFWLKELSIAINRINDRVKKGGHFVDTEIVKRRYLKGIKNLFDIFIPISDNWFVYDNSDKYPVLVASGKGFEILRIFKKEIWEHLYIKINGTKN
ncbi:MAG: zeta toxin family protein [Ignavibacteriae bacterium]|nr:zeta toxin family protein [Ignavibacteriota bacterium]